MRVFIAFVILFVFAGCLPSRRAAKDYQSGLQDTDVLLTADLEEDAEVGPWPDSHVDGAGLDELIQADLSDFGNGSVDAKDVHFSDISTQHDFLELDFGTQLDGLALNDVEGMDIEDSSAETVDVSPDSMDDTVAPNDAGNNADSGDDADAGPDATPPLPFNRIELIKNYVLPLSSIDYGFGVEHLYLRGGTFQHTGEHLLRVPLAGGTVESIAEVVNTARFRITSLGPLSFIVFDEINPTSGVQRLTVVSSDDNSHKFLSHDPVGDTNLRIHNFLMNPDGNSVVFLGDTEKDGIDRLYLVPVLGGAIRPLSANLTDNTNLDVESFSLSSDGAWVLYSGDITAEGIVGLYAAATFDGTHNKLWENTTANPLLSVSRTGFDLSRSRALLSGMLVKEEAPGVFTVPLLGGQLTRLSGQQTVVSWKLSENSKYLVFLSSGPDFGLHSVDLDSSESVWITKSLPNKSGIEIKNYELSAGSDKVVYVADGQTDGVVQLFSSPIHAENYQLLSHDVAGKTEHEVKQFILSSSGNHAVFLGDLEEDGQDLVYKVALDSTGLELLCTQEQASDPDFAVLVFDINDKGNRVLYLSATKAAGLDKMHLYSVSINGGEVLRLTEDSGPGRADQLMGFILIPGKEKVLYFKAANPASVFISDLK